MLLNLILYQFLTLTVYTSPLTTMRYYNFGIDKTDISCIRQAPITALNECMNLFSLS